MFCFPAKRQREDDGFMDLDEDSVHERKKPRPLPLRNSPSIAQTSFLGDNYQFRPEFLPSTLTPVDSSDEDEDDEDKRPYNTSINAFHEARHHQQALRPPALVLNTVMDVDIGKQAPPLINGDNLSPWPVSARSNGSLQPSPIPHSLVNQSLNISGGRTATPIYSHFTVDINPEIKMNDADPMVPVTGYSEEGENVETGQKTDWWRRRRLPSPISEDEDALACNNKAAACDIRFNHNLLRPDSPPSLDLQQGQMPSQNPYGCVENQAGTGMIVETAKNCLHQASYPRAKASAQVPGGKTPSKKGKISISMGYRADCDKCQRKVPGHYSHIIRS